MDRIVVNADLPGPRINKHIYGHFSEHLGRCIYDGFYVGPDSSIPNKNGVRTDIVDALKRIRIPNLRWPGGCFADEYHWMDGIGPKEDRPAIVNTHWGGVTETNHFGTHEFMDLCSQLECDPYICGNLGSGSVYEMQQWVEYLTHDGAGPMSNLRTEHGREQPWRVPFWGVGNENWGCGGNMRAEYYADEYRRYQTYVRNFGENSIAKIACGPNDDDYHWTEVMMREARRGHGGGRRFLMDGLSLHMYTWQRGERGSATRFEEEDWFTVLHKCLAMDTLIRRHGAIMDQYDPDKQVGLVVDEWGTWYEVEPDTNPRFLYQQNSIRDALVAGLTLNIFNAHADRVSMANIAQTVNVLQAMVLTEGEKMLLTPTFHVFDLYSAHQDAALLPCVVEADKCGPEEASVPTLSASASRAGDGSVCVTLVHTDPNGDRDVSLDLRGCEHATVTGRILSGGAITAHNTFDAPDTVVPQPLDPITLVNERAVIRLPAGSVASLNLGG